LAQGGLQATTLAAEGTSKGFHPGGGSGKNDHWGEQAPQGDRLATNEKKRRSARLVTEGLSEFIAERGGVLCISKQAIIFG
jgi:hypothetical protein